MEDGNRDAEWWRWCTGARGALVMRLLEIPARARCAARRGLRDELRKSGLNPAPIWAHPARAPAWLEPSEELDDTFADPPRCGGTWTARDAASVYLARSPPPGVLLPTPDAQGRAARNSSHRPAPPAAAADHVGSPIRVNCARVKGRDGADP